jgi:hypothetical protein
MEPRQFDALVQSLTTTGSRRDTLRRVAGALAALGIAASPVAATARHSPPSPQRKRRRHACAAGLTRCPVTTAKQHKRPKHHKHACVNLQTDPTHCGACGHACGANETCQSGQCAGSGCPNGAKDCGGVCQQCCSPTDCPSASCSEATCTDGVCGLNPIPGCCTHDGECDDQNTCTVDSCVGNACQHVPAAAGTSCGGNQVCCGATCCDSGQICQSGNCAAPCTPTTCAALDRTCGSAPDGCGGTLNCGTCDFGKFCSNGQCVGCSVDSDCTSGGPCKQGACVIDERLRGRCQYSSIPGCCTTNGDCHLNPCDVSVSCVNGQCVHVSACFGCMSCGADGGCSVSTCPQCQYCAAGGVCAADTDQNGQECPSGGVCWNGQCGCIPNGERCGGANGVSGCCSGVCHSSFSGFFCSPPGI